ncbi:MAG: hypothetical protein R6W75_12895 [Smithellaceae bacterium]
MSNADGEFEFLALPGIEIVNQFIQTPKQFFSNFFTRIHREYRKLITSDTRNDIGGAKGL